MTFTELFGLKEVALPARHSTIDFISFMKRRFTDFLSVISQLDENDWRCNAILSEKRNVEKSCNAILEAIKSYYRGLPSKAFSHVNQAIGYVKQHFDRICLEGVPGKGFKNLYRLRVTHGSNLEKKELFHIPFEHRGKVENQRYSIYGLPCLYLGSSLYVCWEELGRPEFNSLQISRFQIEPKTRLAIVDFGIRPQRIHQNLVEPSNGFNYSKEFYDDIDKDYISKAICWPILFACSIKVREPNAVFKPEYIIPQLILEWVTTERGYEGIRYFSLVLPNYRLDDELFFNYVFPVRTRPSKGLCSYLVNLFKMTEPISWGLARSMYLSSESNYEGNLSNNFNIIDSLSCKYSTTEFGRVQNIVDDLPLSYIGN